VFKEESKELYNKYRELSDGFENLVIVGRLADYRYYDMDDDSKKGNRSV